MKEIDTKLGDEFYY